MDTIKDRNVWLTYCTKTQDLWDHHISTDIVFKTEVKVGGYEIPNTGKNKTKAKYKNIEDCMANIES